MFTNIMTIIKNNKFLSNILKLMLGTAFGQIILIIATPLLTRIYSPSDFGLYGNFIAIVSVISVVASMRYELAIVIPKEDTKALKVMMLSIYILIINTILVSLMFLIFGSYLSEKYNWYDKQFTLLIPFFLINIGSYQILNYWMTRKQKFKSLAYSQTLRSFSTVLAQLIFGWFFIGVLKDTGLILGHVIGQLIAVVFLLYIICKTDKKFSSFKISQLKKVAIEYKDFPIYSSGTSLVNTASNQLPILLLTVYFSTTVSGLYLLSNRILNVPIGILGNAVAQVFLQKSASDKLTTASTKNAFNLWKFLMPISLLINLIIFIFAPQIFEVAFGEEWRTAGEYARILSIWTLFKFVGTPLSSISYTYNKQRKFFLYQIVVFLMRLIALLIGGYYDNVMLALILFSLTGALFNLKTIGMYVEIESGKKEASIVRVVNAIIFLCFLLFLFIFK